jgi:hypothetical protein
MQVAQGGDDGGVAKELLDGVEIRVADDGGGVGVAEFVEVGSVVMPASWQKLVTSRLRVHGEVLP